MANKSTVDDERKFPVVDDVDVQTADNTFNGYPALTPERAVQEKARRILGLTESRYVNSGSKYDVTDYKPNDTSPLLPEKFILPEKGTVDDAAINGTRYYDDRHAQSKTEPSSPTSAGKGKAQVVEKSITPEENVLNDFVNYTYNIDLYIMSPDEYNALQDDEDSPENFTKNLLISSANRGAGHRHPEFGDHFYIDDLDLTTISSTSSVSRNTNVTNVKFKIVEPSGITLLERIQRVVETTFNMDIKRYTQLPYLLKITFTGYDDFGKPQSIPKSTRWVPLKITNLTFEVTEQGTVYSVAGVPFNMSAFEHAVENIPIMIEIRGKTIEHFLSNGVTQVNTVLREKEVGPGGNLTETIATQVPGTKSYSLSELLNNYGRGLTSNFLAYNNQSTQNHRNKKPQIEYRKHPDTYAFEFYDNLGKAEIKYDSVVLEQIPNNTKFTNNDHLQTLVANLNKKSFKLDSDNNLFRVSQGTSLVKVLELLMLHSSYIRDQLKISENSDEPLNWFKITPEVRLGPWDDIIGRFSVHIKYKISTHVLHHVNFKNVPRGKPGAAGVHKEYNYLFTGQNQDLINFDIKYKTAYYRQSSLQLGDDKIEDTALSTGVDGSFNSKIEVSPRGTNAINIGMTSSGTSGQVTKARDLAKTVLTDGVEMMGLTAEIIGDPAYIQQSDIFRQKHLRKENNLPLKPFLDDGSINYDYGNVLVKVNFKFPTDYDENTGLMDLGTNAKYRASDDFSGIYMITHVTNHFSAGQFTQSLRGPRRLEQKDVDKTSVHEDQRVEGQELNE